MTLEQFFAENREVAIAFSGGVDSAYLLYAAKRYAARVKAYYVSTAFQPEFELEDARRLADELGADMLVLHVDVLSNSAVTANPSDRCYHCKNTLFRQILRAAENDGFPVLLDGTNASDDAGDRPGMRALRELSVRSPLRECGLTKAEIRRLGQQIKLQGYTLVPLSLYFKKGRVKLELGLCKGKKLYDKRASAAARDAKRDIDRALKTQR